MRTHIRKGEDHARRDRNGDKAPGRSERRRQSLGDAADETPAAVVDEQDSAEENEQGQETPDAAGETDAAGESEQDKQGPAESGEQADGGEDAPANEMKVVVSIKGGRAVIGVQQPSSDPHIEPFDDHDLPALAQEVPAVVERARARWEESPKHPAYERPAPPAKRRNNRRQQGTAQGTTTEAQEAETQQQTLRLF